jgi:hypothetical protein
MYTAHTSFLKAISGYRMTEHKSNDDISGETREKYISIIIKKLDLRKKKLLDHFVRTPEAALSI